MTQQPDQMAEAFPAAALAQAGLNLQHVFSVDQLPPALLQPLAPTPAEHQLILLGHGGRRLWDAVQAANIGGDHPIDTHVRQTIEHCFAQHFAPRHYRIVYPGDAPVGLQALGQLAGWHHASPFGVGVNGEWGSWFAYRAVILAATHFCPSQAVDRGNPCAACRDKPCIDACPAAACGTPFRVQPCVDERLRAGSACAQACLARQACPVGDEHRYATTQIAHSYATSLRMIESWRRMG